MKANPILSDEEFSKRYQKLAEPFYKANLSLMYDLIDDKVFQAIVKEARAELGITSNGRRPNKPKSYLKFVEKNKCVYSIYIYTTTFQEKNILHGYIKKIIAHYNGLEHFKEAFANYIVHNLVFAPDSNVKLSFRIRGDGRSPLPEFSFGRLPHGNDWKIAKLLLQNRYISSFFIDRLPNKFKKSYRGREDLDKHRKILDNASNRRVKYTDQVSMVEKSYDRTNAEIAEKVYRTKKKKDAVRKRLSRQKTRVAELNSP